MKIVQKLKWLGSKGKTFTQPSRTTPDQTLTLVQILKRHSNGMPISGNRQQPIYHGDVQMPDLRTMDISELVDFKNDLKRYTADLNAQIKKAQQEEAERLRTTLQKKDEGVQADPNKALDLGL